MILFSPSEILNGPGLIFPEKKDLWVITAHFKGGDSQKDHDLRNQEVYQLLKYIKTKIPSNSLIALGGIYYGRAGFYPLNVAGASIFKFGPQHLIKFGTQDQTTSGYTNPGQFLLFSKSLENFAIGETVEKYSYSTGLTLQNTPLMIRDFKPQHMSCSSYQCRSNNNAYECKSENGISFCGCSDGYIEINGNCVVDRCKNAAQIENGQCINDGSSSSVSYDCDPGFVLRYDSGNRPNCVSKCPAGKVWSREECVADPCINVSCSGHGQCISENGQATCKCNDGYFLDANNLECVNPCENNSECGDFPCEVRVTTMNENSTADSWEQPDDICGGECEGFSCSWNGKCVPEKSIFGQLPVCKCNKGYVNSGYMQCVDVCNTINCSVNGFCIKSEEGEPNCSCDDNYEGTLETCHKRCEPGECYYQGSCIKGKCEDVVCRNNSCSSNSRCKVNLLRQPVCECNDGFHKDPNTSKCVSNTKKVSCPNNPPANATLDSKDVEVYWDGTKWSSPRNCSWRCKSGYHTEDYKKCISNTRQEDCKEPDLPEHATLIKSKVTTTWNGIKWSTPEECKWECEDGFHKENGSCVDNSITKTEVCKNEAPEHATSILVDVEVTWNESTGAWNEAATCDWECYEGFEKIEGACVGSETKSVYCNDDLNNFPLNALPIVKKVTVKWNGTEWEKPGLCDWTCKNGFVREADKCVEGVCNTGSIEQIACGHNLNGEKTRSCNKGKWEQWSNCIDRDECRNGNFEIETRYCQPGYMKKRKCVDGKWGSYGNCTKKSCSNISCGNSGKCLVDETTGDPFCSCEKGAVADGFVCIENSCKQKDCPTHSFCKLDIYGNAACECREGFVLDSKGNCVPTSCYPNDPCPSYYPGTVCFYSTELQQISCHCKPGKR